MANIMASPSRYVQGAGELKKLCEHVKLLGSKLFVLTTLSIHWFQERGFTPVDIELLPESKKEMYNYQRRSKVLMADLG